MHRAIALSIAATAAALAAAPAHAQLINNAASALERDPVYVHPDAQPTISDAGAQGLRDRIANAGTPIYVAVLPATARREAGGDVGEVLRAIYNGLGRRGVYVVSVGGQIRAGSTGGTGLQRGEAGRLATAAFRRHRDEGLEPTLLDFVARVTDARSASAPAGGGERDGDGSPPTILLVLGGLAVGGFGFVALRRRRRQAAELGQVREAAREDLVALAEDVSELEDDVEQPSSPAGAKELYNNALACYARASESFDRARRPADMEPVTAALEEGRFEMASAKALLEGRRIPERTPPCFFDPRHGPSTREVEWAPAGGVPRAVPACEADALRVEEGGDPDIREIAVDGARVPYWNAPAHYGPWAGGYFGSFGGLFPGLLVGSMLGGSLFSAGDAHAGSGADDVGDVGGGDFGGDFGGGDFGGGDFGGGDFGGGS